MTNEELAIQIQLGHTEHYSELWQNVRRLMYKILHNKISRLELPNYITAEDMEQELYFAFSEQKSYNILIRSDMCCGWLLRCFGRLLQELFLMPR